MKNPFENAKFETRSPKLAEAVDESEETAEKGILQRTCSWFDPQTPRYIYPMTKT